MSKTPKRSRFTEEEATKAGLRSHETLEGRRWLMKALNPADVTVQSVGIPSQDVHNIAVLNWQGDYDISAPPGLSATIPSFDVDLYLGQNPVLFGVSIAAPTGTIDLSQVRQFQLSYAGTQGQVNGTVVIEPSEAPVSSVAPRMTRQIWNNQIDGTPFYQSNSIAAKRVLYSQVTQKTRITYGSATIIPTCSDLNNGGAISACQQVCVPRTTPLEENPSVFLKTYETGDFPSVSDTIQNPQMYYSRFYDGLYAPYKLRNFNNPEFVSSEKQTTTRSPYVVTGVSAIGLASAPTGSTPNIVYAVKEVPLEFVPSPSSTGFTISNTNVGKFYVSANGQPDIFAIRFYVTTLTGQRGYFDFSLVTIQGEDGPSKLFFNNDTLTSPCDVSAQPGKKWISEGNNPEVEFPDPDDMNLAANSANTLVLPSALTMYQNEVQTTSLDNPDGAQFVSMDITPSSVYPELRTGTIPDNVGQSMLTIHMTGISSTAPVKLIIRFGVEFQLTSNSIYSPNKFVGPKYDESALKSYGRCTRNMRDAFFANAGVPAGQPDFVQRLRALLDYDAPDDLMRIMNQGGVFQGSIGG